MPRWPFALLPAVLTLAVWLVPASASAQPDIADDELEPIPVLRVALGPSLGLTPQPHAELAVETTVGVTALPGIVFGVALNAEAGYLHESGYGDGGLDAGVLTLGVGVAGLGSAVMYHPRLIVGGYEGELAVGMRNGVMAHIVADLASVELGHQFVSVRESAVDPEGRTLRHDVRMMLGLNLGSLVWITLAADEAL